MKQDKNKPAITLGQGDKNKAPVSQPRYDKNNTGFTFREVPTQKAKKPGSLQ